MGEGYICYEWGVVHANQTIVIYASYIIQVGNSYQSDQINNQAIESMNERNKYKR